MRERAPAVGGWAVVRVEVAAGLLQEAAALCRELAAWASGEIADSAADAVGSARAKTDAADWVTDVDLAVERRARQIIAARFPGHRLRGEEHGEGGAQDSPFTWYLDPVDGTCNFAQGIPWYAFSVALLHGEEPVAGAVADPQRREVVWAVRGGGLHVGDRRAAAVRPTAGEVPQRLAGRVVMLELANARHWPGLDACLRHLERRLVTARIMGSSALAVTQAALGRAVGAVLGGSSPIDVGAAVLFAREAGLSVLGGDDGAAAGWPRGGLVAAPPGIAEDLWASAFSAQARGAARGSGSGGGEA